MSPKKTIACSNCGEQVLEGNKFCGSCGKQMITENICKKCGSINPLSNKFCKDCGEKVTQPSPSRAIVLSPTYKQDSQLNGKWFMTFLGQSGSLALLG